MIKKFSVGNWFPADIRKILEVQSVRSESNFQTYETEYHPWKILNIGDAKVKIVEGRVKGNQPSGLVQTYEDDGTEYSMSNNDELFVKVTVDNYGSITTVEITKSEPITSETCAYFRIGKVQVADGQITSILQSVRSDQDFISCGVNHFFGAMSY